jgi:hypothetical protein
VAGTSGTPPDLSWCANRGGGGHSMVIVSMRPAAKQGAAIRNNSLHPAAAAVERLTREFNELQQLREAVTVAELTYLNEQHRPRAQPLS